MSPTEDFDDDSSQFTTDTIEDITTEDIFGNPAPRPVNENGLEQASNHDEIDSNPQNLRVENINAQPVSESPIPDDLLILLDRHVP